MISTLWRKRKVTRVSVLETPIDILYDLQDSFDSSFESLEEKSRQQLETMPTYNSESFCRELDCLSDEKLNSYKKDRLSRGFQNLTRVNHLTVKFGNKENSSNQRKKPEQTVSGSVISFKAMKNKELVLQKIGQLQRYTERMAGILTGLQQDFGITSTNKIAGKSNSNKSLKIPSSRADLKKQFDGYEKNIRNISQELMILKKELSSRKAGIHSDSAKQYFNGLENMLEQAQNGMSLLIRQAFVADLPEKSKRCPD